MTPASLVLAVLLVQTAAPQAADALARAIAEAQTLIDKGRPAAAVAKLQALDPAQPMVARRRCSAGGSTRAWRCCSRSWR